MKKSWRWNERTRMLLTLELAIVLPAAALIAYSVWNLRTFQRDRAVEAAIQMEFGQVLKIAEKQLNHDAGKRFEAVRDEFPCPDDAMPAAKLEQFLAARPEFAHVFFYQPEAGLIFRSQPRRLEEPYFRKESAELEKHFQVVKNEAKNMIQKLRKMEKAGEPFLHYAHWVPREKGYGYTAYALTTLPKWPKDSMVIAGAVLDSEYLREELFPGALNHVLAKDPHGGRNGGAVMMVHERRSAEPLAASLGWDGGKPEVGKPLEGAFPGGLALAIKFRGTTIEAMSQRFLRNSFATVGGLSLLLAAGILLTWRNVAREMALAKTKSDFVANVSHELRTPLSLIRLYAETLELGRVTAQEKVREYYCIIRKESERLSALINNILDFSRIEAGKKEYDFRETDLSDLVRKTLDSYRYQIEQNGFRFEENIAAGLPPVRVDREAIARSLLNLVNNALKYSPDEKYLGVNLYPANGAVKLEVIDRGIGIPTGEQAKVFEKFYRAGDPLVHNTKGSGLGLSLVRHIVQAHGGQVSLESAPGKGSKFTIALPLEAGPLGGQRQAA